MKIAQYQQMMAYLMRPKFNGGGSVGGNFVKPKKKPEKEVKKRKKENFEKAKDALENPDEVKEMMDLADGGRIGFDKGGVAKVLTHLDSLPEGADVDLEYIRKYIADNNINAQPEGIFKQLEPNKINRKQIAASGNETFTYNKEKRELLTRLNKKLNLVKAREYVPATKENLEKLDNLIKNTKLNTKEIAKKMGFGEESFSFTRTNPLITEYLKKYGPPPEGRFKAVLTADSAKVKKAIELKESGLSVRQIADELNVDRPAVTNYFRKGGRDDLVGKVNVKKPGSANQLKINRLKEIAKADKFASKSNKAFNKLEEKRVKILNQYVKENAEKLADNKNIENLINLKLDLKGNILSKNKSPEEILKSLKRDRFFERDHISSVSKKKRNMQFPVNFQISPYNINQGFFNAVETYAKRPDADPAKLQKISGVLNQYGLRLDTGKGIIGAKQIPASEVIDRNLKALGLSTEIGKSSGPTLGANIGLLKGVGETIKAIPTLAGGLALNLAFQPDLSSGVDRAALGAEAAFAPELVKQASRVTSNPIVQRFFNLGLSPKMAMRAARIASPIGLATLAGEGLYQAGKYAIDRRKELQSMSPVERDRLRQESDAFSFNEFSAAGGGIAKLAGKSSGRPPESGPTPQGLDFLIKRGRQS